MSAQYGEIRPINGWDRSGSLRHPCKFQRVSRLGSVTARWASANLCGVEQRAPTMFGRATITLGIGPHSSFSCLSLDTCMTCLGSSQVSMSRDCVLTVSVRHSYNCLLWSPYGIGQTIIFSSCFFFLFYFLAPNLSGQRLDVYRTSTRGVALVRI